MILFYCTSRLSQGAMKKFDYIIAGAGSAGCVLAKRLSQNYRVLLLEAGGSDSNILIKMPSALIYPLNMSMFTWKQSTVPQTNLNNRVIFWPHGKVVGGSSSINGMAYVRGNALDFEEWSKIQGLENWSYADCLPYFRRAECRDKGGDEYRGNDGPLFTTTGDPSKNPLYEAWIEAGKQCGYKQTTDMNGFQQEGLSTMQMTIKNGRRWSAADAYLDGNPNLEISKNTIVHSLELTGKKVTGIKCIVGGTEKVFRAENEIVVSSGAIHSPLILMRSGIGNFDDLRQFDVQLNHHLPGVGYNLQDHLEVFLQNACKKPITLSKYNNLLGKLRVGIEWILTRKGIGATNHFETGGFIRSRAGIEYPNIQYHFVPTAMGYTGDKAFKGHGYQAHVGPMRSKSRGHVKLKTLKPLDDPMIDPKYLSHEEDFEEFRACIRLTREIFDSDAFKPFKDYEIQPGVGIQSDKEIDEWIRNSVESAYHACGSCKMGYDESSVVDSEGRVHGIDNLRVVDASIFPLITTGNLNAPTIMIAEKIADSIQGKKLSPSTAPFYTADDWKSKQR